MYVCIKRPNTPAKETFTGRGARGVPTGSQSTRSRPPSRVSALRRGWRGFSRLRGGGGI